MLDVQPGKALVISRCGLDTRQYNARWSDITWRDSTLRKWLNDEFLSQAFTSDELAAVLTTNVDNGARQLNGQWESTGGTNTQDRLFLLSYAEVVKYFPEEKDRAAVYTDAAIKAVNDGSMSFEDLKAAFYKYYDGCYHWYLRSFKEGDFLTGNVNFPEMIQADGSTSFMGTSPILTYGIRPAMVLDLNVALDLIQIVE